MFKILNVHRLLMICISFIIFVEIKVLAVADTFQCGVQDSEVPSTKSSFVRQYEYPWKAAIRKKSSSNEFKFLGSGTLVSENKILTMAHLISNGKNSIDPSEFRIVLGLTNLEDKTEPGLVSILTTEVIIHPSWDDNSSTFEGDIAILILSENITFGRQIQPICIPNKKISSIQSGEISSWARQENTQGFSSNPRKATVQIIKNSDCYEREPELASIAWNKSFCSRADNYSFCSGSSGVGFYVKKHGIFYLRGMISSTVQHQECGKPNLVLNTDILMYVEFLKQNGIHPISSIDDTFENNCGTAKSLVGRISYGESFPQGLLPWLAALIRYKQKGPKFICGATLISAKSVVTAAHCVHGKGLFEGFKNYELRVLLGAHDLSDPYEPGRITERVLNIIIHSTWNPSDTQRFTGDIAILELERSVHFDDYIQPACLSSYLPNVDFGVVAGWGRWQNQTFGTSNKKPTRIDIPIVNEKTCYEKESILAKGGWDKSFCAGRKGASVCDGDSGSGYFVYLNGRYYLKGIVSNAVIHENCDEGYFALFSDAVKYNSFIKEESLQ